MGTSALTLPANGPPMTPEARTGLLGGGRRDDTETRSRLASDRQWHADIQCATATPTSLPLVLITHDMPVPRMAIGTQ